MAKLEVYFDYVCPHCLRGHEYLEELLPLYPNVDVEWVPCECHPRPESHGAHSDLIIRSMYLAKEQGADLTEYHNIMYKAAIKDKGQVDIEDIDTIAGLTSGMLDKKKLTETLKSSKYEDTLKENNRLAWGEYGFDAVPSYRMNGKILKSALSVGVSKEQLAEFLSEAE